MKKKTVILYHLTCSVEKYVTCCEVLSLQIKHHCFRQIYPHLMVKSFWIWQCFT